MKFLLVFALASQLAFATSGVIELGPTVGGGGGSGDATSLQGTPISSTPPLDGQVLEFNSVSGKWEPATVSGTGTVTSVDVSVPAFLTISGNPITTSGTLAFGLSNQNANAIFAGPNSGSPDVPSFRALIVQDLPQGSGGSYLSYDQTTGYQGASPFLTSQNDTTNIQAVNAVFNVANTVTSLAGFIYNPQVDGATLAGGTSLAIDGIYGATTATAISNQIDMQINSQFEDNAVVTDYSGINLGPTFTAGSTVGDFKGLSIQPDFVSGVSGTGFIGINIDPAGSLSPVNATGLRINMTNLHGSNETTSIQTQGGVLNVGSFDTIQSAASFQQGNTIGITAQNLTPVTGTDYVGNFLLFLLDAQDDISNGPSGIGVNQVGYVGNVNIASGKTVAQFNGVVSGFSASSATGAITDAASYVAIGGPLGSGPAVTNNRGFYVPTLFNSTAATHAWGVYVEASVDNWFSKDLVIGGTTMLPVTQSVGLQISGTDKALVLSRMNTTQKNALTPFNGMMVFDTTLAEFDCYSSGAWAACGGGGGGSAVLASYQDNSGQSTNSATWQLLGFNTLLVDPNSDYNGTTYTVPTTGNYFINASILTDPVVFAPTQLFGFAIWKNGSIVLYSQRNGQDPSNAIAYSMGVSGLLPLAAGDTLQVKVYNTSTPVTLSTGTPTGNNFSVQAVTTGGGGGGGATTALDNLLSITNINAPLTFQAGTTGTITTSDSSTADTDPMLITSGNATGHNSGAVLISPGSSTGTRGIVQVDSPDFQLVNDGGAVSQISFYDGGGSNYTSFAAPVSLSGTTNFTWPDGDGSPGDSLTTDGAGTLSWASGGGGANVTLSNLTAPTSINADFIFDTGADPVVIQSKDQASANTAGLLIQTGSAPSGSFTGGDLTLRTQNTNTGAPGRVVLQTGADNTGIKAADILIGNGHLRFNATAPAVSACGTSPSIAGNDVAGRVTVGAGGLATSCTVTFTFAWGTKPVCFVSDESAIIATQVVPTTTAFTVSTSLAFLAGTVLDYHCVGY